MTRLLRSSADPYDVLGLAPDASFEEIETAFVWLLRGKHFRHDVPLSEWPQRVREIKAAYQTLRDPAKRHAYDQSLRGAPTAMAWAGTGIARESVVGPLQRKEERNPANEPIVGAGSDEGTDTLVSGAKRRRREPVAGELINNAAASLAGGDTPSLAAATEADISKPVRAAKMPLTRSRQAPDLVVRPRKGCLSGKGAKQPTVVVGGAGPGAASIVLAAGSHESRKRTKRKPINPAPVAADNDASNPAPAAASKASSPVPHRKANRDNSQSTRIWSAGGHHSSEVEQQSAGSAALSFGEIEQYEHRPGSDKAPALKRAGWAHVARRTWNRTPARTFRKWGVPASVTLGLAAVLIASWPSANSGPPRSDRRDRVPETVGSFSVVDSPAATSPMDTGVTAGDELSLEEQSAAEADASAASASLKQWFVPGAEPITETASSDDSAMLPTGTSAEEQFPAGAAPSVAPAAPQGPAASIASSNSAPSVASPIQAGPAGAPAAQVARVLPLGNAALAATARAPLSSPAKLLSGGPVDADNHGRRYRGSVAVRFTVSPDGRGFNCTAFRGSGNSKLDALTCQILVERARFTPARDAQGRLVASELRAIYVWGRGRRPKS